MSEEFEYTNGKIRSCGKWGMNKNRGRGQRCFRRESR